MELKDQGRITAILQCEGNHDAARLSVVSKLGFHGCFPHAPRRTPAPLTTTAHKILTIFAHSESDNTLNDVRIRKHSEEVDTASLFMTN